MDDAEKEATPVRHVTADQVVAMNIRYWRKKAGLKQEELAERLGKSPANWSAVERSAEDGRDRRRFDAQTLVALSLALGVPLAALLLPPEDDGHGKRYVMEMPGGEKDMADLLGHVVLFPPDDLSDLAETWRARLNRAARKHLSPDFAERTAQLLAEEEEPSMRSEIAAMFRAEAEREQEDMDARRDHLAFLWRVAEHLDPFPARDSAAEAGA